MQALDTAVVFTRLSHTFNGWSERNLTPHNVFTAASGARHKKMGTVTARCGVPLDSPKQGQRTAKSDPLNTRRHTMDQTQLHSSSGTRPAHSHRRTLL